MEWLCGERGMLGFFRILARRLRWCKTWFISLLLFGPIALMFSNLSLWVLFSLVGSQYVLLRVRPTWWGVKLCFRVVFFYSLFILFCTNLLVKRRFSWVCWSCLYFMRIYHPSYVLLSLINTSLVSNPKKKKTKTKMMKPYSKTARVLLLSLRF